MSNISTLLAQSAQQNPQGIAIIAPGKPPAGGPSSPATPPETSTQNWQQIRFGELDTYVSRIAGGMARMGIRPGDRALVMVKAGIDLIAIAYALFRLGAVPILIDPGMGIKNFLSCVARSQPTAFIGIPLAHAIRVFFPGSFRSVKHPITVGPRLFWGGESLQSILKGAEALHPPESSPDALAAILFTSGSTGPAKGVMYTHGMFAAQVAALKRVFDYQPGEVDLAAFPLFSLFDGALGMTTVIPDLDPGKPGKCNPALVADAARAWRATSVTGSPAIWRRVFPWCKQQKWTLPALKRVVTFGAPIPPAFIEMAKDILPNGDVYTPYGATESLPVACIAGRQILQETAAATTQGAGTCIGKPDVDVRIIAISDAAIPDFSQAQILADGEIGEICVRGPVVTEVYDALPEATANAKIRDAAGLWHRMGDLGYRDAQGRLWFCGRKAERLQTAKGPLYTDCVEGVFNGWPDIQRCALVGPGPQGAQRAVLVVEGPANAALEQKILATAKVEAVVFRNKLPVDTRHNAKIHRLTLKKELESRLALTSGA